MRPANRFRLLLEYVVYFNDLWHKFELIDLSASCVLK